MLTKEERIQSKADKKAEVFAKKHPQPWYKPFVWNPPVFDKLLDAEGREQVKVKTHGFFQMNYMPGTKSVSGEREYEVQKSGALKALNKAPSKRDLHRQGLVHE